jgi:Protein of unknown function (DUF3024)
LQHVSDEHVSDAKAAALRAVEDLCESRVPDDLRDEMRVECLRRGNAITVVERRAPWSSETAGGEWTSVKVAQLRFDPSSARWSLHCSDRNGRWSPYERIRPSASVQPLLAAMEADPTGIFWG